jgi:diguanylate cyclase (GGDEF)-like protein
LDKSHKSALSIAGFYLLFAGCWILFSDRVVESLVSNVEEVTWLQTAKGWFFVGVTALLLYLAVKRFTQQIEQAYKLDGMTGLLSHELFKLQLRDLIQARKEDEKTIVAILDINDFKEVNARFGFEMADKMVTEISKSIVKHSLSRSLICRLPPDQFMLARNYSDAIDPDAIDPDVVDVEGRMAGYVNLVAEAAAKLDIEATCSVGVAFCPIDGSSAKQIMDAAVEALRVAKLNRQAIQYHNKALTEQARARRQLVESLQKAIDEELLTLVYQPKYVLDTNELSGIEVLVRWNDVTRGFIPPAEFIPLAEEYGLIHRITPFVMQRAANELEPTGLLGSKIKHVSINVSAVEFNNSQAMDALLARIKKQKSLAPFVRFELTETATLADIQQSSSMLLRLRSEGVGISIDDFGTGYTSLAMLKDLTIDELKIDRSFVSGLGDCGRSTTIISAIIGMARSFNINVVAEGVETEEQLNALKTMRCNDAQGYLLGRPMDIVALQHHLGETESAA